MAQLLPLHQPKTPIRQRSTVDDLYRAYDGLEPGSTTRMELINGEIIVMMPPEAPHSGFTSVANRKLVKKLADTCLVRCQLPIRLSRYSEPQPDIAIVAARKDDYALSHPKADEVLLVIEVSDSSLDTDLNVKRQLYAKAEIPEYWVVDVQSRRLHVFRKPWEEDYTEHECLGSTDSLQCSSIVELALTVSELFPEVG
jgi:Uma2 family endonuclease